MLVGVHMMALDFRRGLEALGRDRWEHGGKFIDGEFLGPIFVPKIQGGGNNDANSKEGAKDGAKDGASI